MTQTLPLLPSHPGAACLEAPWRSEAFVEDLLGDELLVETPEAPAPVASSRSLLAVAWVAVVSLTAAGMLVVAGAGREALPLLLAGLV